jgi:hypothetical protein
VVKYNSHSRWQWVSVTQHVFLLLGSEFEMNIIHRHGWKKKVRSSGGPGLGTV